MRWGGAVKGAKIARKIQRILIPHGARNLGNVFVFATLQNRFGALEALSDHVFLGRSAKPRRKGMTERHVGEVATLGKVGDFEVGIKNV